MASALAILRRIDSNAQRGRGLRLSPEETDLLRTVLELSESHTQAQALDADADPSWHFFGLTGPDRGMFSASKHNILGSVMA